MVKVGVSSDPATLLSMASDVLGQRPLPEGVVGVAYRLTAELTAAGPNEGS